MEKDIKCDCGSKYFYAVYHRKEVFTLYKDEYDDYIADVESDDFITEEIKCWDCDSVLEEVPYENIHFEN